MNPDDVRHKTKTADLVEFNFEEAPRLKQDEKEKVKGFDHTLRYYTEKPSELQIHMQEEQVVHKRAEVDQEILKPI